jgi:TonB family protein
MNTRAIGTDLAGRTIDGRFVLLQWLGGSASSNTYLVQLPTDPAKNAVIRLIPADSPDAEAHITARAVAMPLSHPHLMNVLHHGRCAIDNTAMIYTITEQADEILSQVLLERPLTSSETREMLNPLLDTLAYLHARGLAHAHLKPSNILVVGDQLKLSGDTLHLAGRANMDLLALNIYNAPEISAGSISPAADVWSLGITLVEALSQKQPAWDRSSHGDPLVPESIPQPFADIARACLRSAPEQRCTTSDIKALLESGRPIPKPASRTQWTAPSLRAVAGIVAAMLLVLVAIALHVRSRSSHPAENRASHMPIAEPSTLEPKVAQSAAKGTVAQRVLPDVPSSASQTIRGAVLVKVEVTVDPRGHVTHAAFQSAGPSRYFARMALQSAQQWKFTPALVNGQAVPSRWTIEFQFTQQGTTAIPTEETP